LGKINVNRRGKSIADPQFTKNEIPVFALPFSIY